MRKTLDQTWQPRTVLAQGEFVEMASPWVMQPTMGMLQAKMRKGFQAIPAIEPSVEWTVYAGTSQADFGQLQATLTLTTQALNGTSAPYTTTIDLSGELVQFAGRLSVPFPRSPLTQMKLTLTNWGTGEDLPIQLTQTILAEFSPHHAPAEFEDAGGYGAAPPSPQRTRETASMAAMPSLLADDPLTWDGMDGE